MAEVILALDLPNRDDALRFLDRVQSVTWVKVGSVLNTAAGPDLIRELRSRGLQVFLDLKWHDIPNTVSGAVSAGRRLDVQMATVHTIGGSAMLRAAVAAAGSELGIVGVTVLTSHGGADFGAVLGRPVANLGDEASRLGRIGIDAGLRGLVCSPLEVARLRREIGPAPWLVVPGIRSAHDSAGDQARTATARDAARAGATHLVVGRPVLEAGDPNEVWLRLVEEAVSA